MKFVLFFYLMSLTVITGAILAEDAITDSGFYRQYFSVQETVVGQQPIQYNELPSEVLQGFSKSTFGDKSISQAYVVPASAAPSLLYNFVLNNTPPKKIYLLTLANEHYEISTKLKFTGSGKLINVQR